MSREKQEVKKRIFIAINFPSPIKEKLLEYQKQWPKLPVRWTSPKNLHLTLIFLGYISSVELAKIFTISQQIARQTQPFVLRFKRIILGPSEKAPRMFWVEIERKSELSRLQNKLAKELSLEEKRPFKPHLTLARIKTNEWKQPGIKPRVDQPLSLTAPVTSLEIMASQLSSRGPQYTILKSYPLGKFDSYENLDILNTKDSK